MGLATIEPRSQKEHTEIHKIPKFGVNQASFGWDLAIQNVLAFSNGCTLLTIGSIYTRLRDFVKLGLHFTTMWINSC